MVAVVGPLEYVKELREARLNDPVLGHPSPSRQQVHKRHENVLVSSPWGPILGRRLHPPNLLQLNTVLGLHHPLEGVRRRVDAAPRRFEDGVYLEVRLRGNQVRTLFGDSLAPSFSRQWPLSLSRYRTPGSPSQPHVVEHNRNNKQHNINKRTQRWKTNRRLCRTFAEVSYFVGRDIFL